MPSASTLILHQVGRSQPAFFHKQRDTGTDKLAGGPARGQLFAHEGPFDRCQRLVEQTRIVAGIENDFGAERVERTRIRHFVLGDQVSPPNLNTIQTKLVCNRIEQPLTDECALEPAGRAIGPARSFVCQPNMSLGSVGRNPVRARQHRRGEIGNGRRMGPHIGALIVKNLILQREDASFAVDGGADVMELLA